MPLRSLRSRSYADQVFDQLLAELISERYAPGASLPSERELVDTCGVARHVVREAIKRLEQIGLVRTTRGGATRVLNFKKEAGLDLLALLAEHAHGGDEILLYARAVLEMRAAIGADIVRLCAERGDMAVRQELVSLAKSMAAAKSDEQLFSLEIRFWERLLDGADNIAYRLAVNSLLKGSAMIGAAARDVFVHEIRTTGFRQRIAEAIRSGLPEEAERLAREALRSSVQVASAPTSEGTSRRPVATPAANAKAASTARARSAPAKAKTKRQRRQGV